MLRRLRGLLGIAATWGVAFAGVGVIAGSLAALTYAVGAMPPQVGSREISTAIIAGIARWAAVGALSGIVFSVTVMMAERRQTLATLSPRRFARWGGLAGAVGSIAVVGVFVVAFLPAGFVAASGGSLAGSLLLVPIVGGALGRSTATATLRAARQEVGAPRALEAESPMT
jgi:hypothetical protein